MSNVTGFLCCADSARFEMIVFVVPSNAAVASSPKLLDRLRWLLRAKHYSIRTEQAYGDWIRRFILFHQKRHPGPASTAFLCGETFILLMTRASNQTLERTADRREDLLSMTSTLKSEAPFAFVGGRSAWSR
jgi:Phage integrase, N-terminal SAM-like domain